MAPTLGSFGFIYDAKNQRRDGRWGCGTAFGRSKPSAFQWFSFGGRRCIESTLLFQTEMEARIRLILAMLMVRVRWWCVLRIVQSARGCVDKSLPLRLSRECLKPVLLCSGFITTKKSVSFITSLFCNFPDKLDVKANNVRWCPRCTRINRSHLYYTPPRSPLGLLDPFPGVTFRNWPQQYIPLLDSL